MGAPRKEKGEEEGSFRGWREGTFFSSSFFSGPEDVGAVAGFGPFLRVVQNLILSVSG